jgi:glycogen debranching enzyme
VTTTTTDLSFSITEVPFSCAGSWLDVSPVVAENRVERDLHLVSHHTGLHAVLALVPVLAGGRAEVAVTASPAVLTWTHDEGRVDLAFETPDTIRITGTTLGLSLMAAHPTLTPFSGTYFFRDPVTGAHVFTSYETGRRYRVTVLAGTVEAVGSEALGTHERGVVVSADEGAWEVVVETYRTSRRPFRSTKGFDEVVRDRGGQFDAFLDAVAPWRDGSTPAAALAAYVLWSATVDPEGFVRRPAVLMSKHWMDKVWSWDHCFNALALAGGAPELAWDQFLTPFDHQDESGALPDSVTHSEVLHNFVKPPIHGWALGQLRGRLARPLDRAQLDVAYRHLDAWTRFWLDHRRAEGHRLAHYQHGNDSGWDNATTFDGGGLVESADLAAFLVLQMRQLAALADELGKTEDARVWGARADDMFIALLDELWDGERFASRHAITGAHRTTDSLLDLMAVILGEHLPEDHRLLLVDRVERHLSHSGLATERADSPHYEDDGYWRGPVWAPSTVLIEDGLRRGGATELADLVSTRFREVCEKSGFAENFDARTGGGLRDRSYTWTAGAYLVLAGDAVRRRS